LEKGGVPVIRGVGKEDGSATFYNPKTKVKTDLQNMTDEELKEAQSAFPERGAGKAATPETPATGKPVKIDVDSGLFGDPEFDALVARVGEKTALELPTVPPAAPRVAGEAVTPPSAATTASEGGAARIAERPPIENVQQATETLPFAKPISPREQAVLNTGEERSRRVKQTVEATNKIFDDSMGVSASPEVIAAINRMVAAQTDEVVTTLSDDLLAAINRMFDARQAPAGRAGVIIDAPAVITPKERISLLERFRRIIPPTLGGIRAGGRPPYEAGNTFIAPMRHVWEIVSEVVNNTGFTGNLAGRLGISPSVLKDTPVGRLLTAHYRQMISGEELTKVAIAAALDRHAARWTGRLPFKISNRGLFGDTGVPWQDVFTQPGKYNLTPAARRYIDDFHQVIDEIEKLRVEAGLKPRGKGKVDGWFYTPRQTKSVRGIDIDRPSSPDFQAVYEDAAEGVANGVRYDIDPRATLDLHVRAAYREIAVRELAGALTQYSVSPSVIASSKVSPELRERLAEAVTKRLMGERKLRRLKRAVAQAEGALKVAPRASKAKRRQALQDARDARDKMEASLGAIRREHGHARAAFNLARRPAMKFRVEVAKGEIFGKDLPNEIPVGVWRGRYFPKDQVKQLEEGLGRFGIRPIARRELVAMNKLGNMRRFTQATADFAMPFIQGQLLLWENPAGWARMTLRHYQAFFDPAVQGRYIMKNIGDFQEMARYSVPTGDPEFFALMERGGGVSLKALDKFLPPLEEARRLWGVGAKQTFGRFQSAYSMGLGTTRHVQWQAKRAGWKGDLESLGAHVRNMSGGLDARALGVGPSQRAVESFWLAYSPRLLRSTIALFNDAFGGVGGLALARMPKAQQAAAMKTLGMWAAGMGGTYVVTGLALGKTWEEIEEGLNPLNGKKFLSHRINGDWYGIGGQGRALMQVIAHVGSTLAPGGKPIEDIIALDLRDNPLIQGWLYRAAIGPQILGSVAEAASGGLLNLAPFDNLVSIPDLAKHLAKEQLPFAAQGIVEGEDVIATASAVAGGRTSPGTAGEARADIRQQIMDEMQEKVLAGTLQMPDDADLTGDFKDLPRDVQRDIGQDPRVLDAQENVNEQSRKFGGQYQVYKDKRDETYEEYQGLILEASRTMTKKEFRFRLPVLYSNRGVAIDGLNEQYKDALAWIEDLPEATNQFNVALNDYNDQLQDPELSNEATGEYDYEERDRRLESLTDNYGQGMIDRIDNYKRGFALPIEKELRADRETIRPYWDINETIKDRISPRLVAIWDKWLKGNDVEKERLKREEPDIKYIKSMVAEERLRFRDKNHGIDTILKKWGYVSKLRPGNRGLTPVPPSPVQASGEGTVSPAVAERLERLRRVNRQLETRQPVGAGR
jgi:hypothetical protein